MTMRASELVARMDALGLFYIQRCLMMIHVTPYT